MHRKDDLIPARPIGSPRQLRPLVQEHNLTEEAVTETKVATNAITTAKIVAAAVSDTKLAAAAVTNTKIAANAVQTAHIDSSVNVGVVPPNGSFEHALLTLASNPPDGWSVAVDTIPASAWGSGSSNYYSTDGDWGRTIVLRGVASNLCRLRSKIFAVRGGARLNQFLVLKGTGAGAGVTNFNVVIEWWKDTSGTAAGTPSTTTVYGTNTGGGFVASTTYRLAVPGDASYASVYVEKAAADSTLTVEVGALFLDQASTAQMAFIAPTLSGTWVNYDTSTYTAAGYMIDSNNRVHLRGLVKDGAAAVSVIFPLPVGYRPTKLHIFAVSSASAYGRVDVQADGDVSFEVGNTAWVSLDGISFSID